MKNIEHGLILDWPGACMAGVKIAGGKGWNLGRLSRYGFFVPAGGVLTTLAYEDFLKGIGLLDKIEHISKTINIDNIEEASVKALLDTIHTRIGAGSIPAPIKEELLSSPITSSLIRKPLAIRSSASAEDSNKASFAGIHESFLNICGFDAIAEAVKGCYASLWTVQAVAYRRRMGIPDNEALMAVVLMEMAQARAAGVAFSCDPRTGREDILTIGANHGLGESVVKGLVDPDDYVLDGSSLEIKHKKIGAKEQITVVSGDGGTESVASELCKSQVLSDEQIKKMGNLILRVFEALGEGQMHQDIEWVFDGENFILVQARPVTALPRVTFSELKDQPEIWSNANIRDAIPMVLPVLSRRTIKNNINDILLSPFKILCYPMPEGIQHVKIFDGRAYLNLSVIQWSNFDALGIYPRDTNINLGGHQPEIVVREEKPYKGIRGLKRLWRMVKFFRAVARYKKKANSYFNSVTESAESTLKRDVRSLDDGDFFPIFSDITALAYEFAPVYMMMNGAGASLSMLVKVLDNHFPDKGASLVNSLMAGKGNITSAQHGYRLMELAETIRNDVEAREFFSSSDYDPLLWKSELPDASPFKHGFKTFLNEFGHRGVYEMDISNPRWNEDPSYLLNSIRGMIDSVDIGKIRMQQKEKSDSAWRAINSKLPYHRRAYIKYLVKQSARGMELRELAKSVYTRLLEPLRVIAREIGRRFEERGILEKMDDIFHCSWVEIFPVLDGEWDGMGLTAIVDERKANFKKMEAISPSDIIIDDNPHRLKDLQLQGDLMQGIAVAAGKSSGPARLIYHPDEGTRLHHGDVLVAPSTDPGWTPLFLRASAILMETGGYYSHGAIVAREYGIPAVVNVSGIMRVLKDGQVIAVDGDEGKVYLSS